MTTTAQNAACWPNIADFNIDGKVDVAIGYVDGNEQVFLGNGDGTFHSVGQSGTFSRPAPVADFNEDGIPDLLLVDTNELCNATVVLGNGDGTFRKGASTKVPNCWLCGVLSVMLTGDGHKDVLWLRAETGNHGVGELLGTPLPTENLATVIENK